MNSLLRSATAVGTTKRLLGGNTLTFVRNAGGPSKPPGFGIPIPPGPRQMEQLKLWTGSAVMFCATAGAAVVYFTDWRVITDWIPFYNGKYKED